MRPRRVFKEGVGVIHIIYCPILELYIIIPLCLQTAHMCFLYSQVIYFHLLSFAISSKKSQMILVKIDSPLKTE